jgi:hypothetical protein
LLLAVRKTGGQPTLDRFLCGHDEREWFVAAVPGGASSVRQAMDALQPQEVRAALTRNQVSPRKRYARKNRAFRRQGEWFIVPEPSVAVDERIVLRNERSVVAVANRMSWKNSSALAARPSTFAVAIQTASLRTNIARFCDANLMPPAGAGR